MSKLSEALNKVDEKDEYCSYASLRNKLDDEDMMALDNAFNRGVPSYVLAKTLRSEGHKISHDTIQDHRDSKCKCPKGVK